MDDAVLPSNSDVGSPFSEMLSLTWIVCCAYFLLYFFLELICI